MNIIYRSHVIKLLSLYIRTNKSRHRNDPTSRMVLVIRPRVICRSFDVKIVPWLSYESRFRNFSETPKQLHERARECGRGQARLRILIAEWITRAYTSSELTSASPPAGSSTLFKAITWKWRYQ